MFKVIKGQRTALEQQLVDAIFMGDTQTLENLQKKLSQRPQLTLIAPEATHQVPVEPETLHQ